VNSKTAKPTDSCISGVVLPQQNRSESFIAPLSDNNFQAQENMSTATFVFMIATYWVGGSAPMEGGKYLANGQLYNNQAFVAAHRTLPLGTILNVCLLRQCVAVVVKDRGPFLPNMNIDQRIDLSYAAAKVLGMLHDGRQRVRVSTPTPRPRPAIEWQEARPGSTLAAQ
jgi:rare lipoprotein A (peptidoglycan hydrolase)